MQIADDTIEPVWRRHGVVGLVRIITDIALRATVEHLAELRQDVRYGLRMLANSPGFALVALVSLSLGIAIATCAYSEVNGLILRDLPGVPKPEELVALQAPTSYTLYKRYRERNDLFSSTLAYVAPVPFGVSLDGHTERIWGHLVTPSYFSTLGVRPVLGRFFEPEQEQPGGAPVIVVSYRFWQQHLGSDPSAVGRTLRINGQPCTVIGVGPKDFLGISPGYSAADVWMPVSVPARLAPELADNALERRDLTMFQMIGRLKPGITADRAEAALDAVARQMEQDYGERRPRKGWPARAAGSRRKSAAHSETRPAVLHGGLDGVGGLGAADRVLQRGQHDAGTGGGPPAGDRSSPGTGCQPCPAHSPVANGKTCWWLRARACWGSS